MQYSWNIRVNTNNMAEALALWQGLVQMKTLGIVDALVF